MLIETRICSLKQCKVNAGESGWACPSSLEPRGPLPPFYPLEASLAAGKTRDMGQEKTGVFQVARILNWVRAVAPEKGGRRNDPRTSDKTPGSSQPPGGVPIHRVPLVLG